VVGPFMQRPAQGMRQRLAHAGLAAAGDPMTTSAWGLRSGLVVRIALSMILQKNRPGPALDFGVSLGHLRVYTQQPWPRDELVSAIITFARTASDLGQSLGPTPSSRFTACPTTLLPSLRATAHALPAPAAASHSAMSQKPSASVP
jgi:hypothetical protein